jgi:FKBP-type peptidyl-prolyl cis-trans isomerase (trigger factor)
MLVNTELLEQEAAERGIVVTDAEVEARIDALVQEIGSEEALNERMMALGIDDETLREDVKSELMIQALLDEVFAEADITVTEEEVSSLYQTTTGGGEDAPALVEIRPQVEAQIRASKEQSVVTEFITELRSDADVEIQ